MDLILSILGLINPLKLIETKYLVVEITFPEKCGMDKNLLKKGYKTRWTSERKIETRKLDGWSPARYKRRTFLKTKDNMLYMKKK
jgi:hypothetical protein